MQLKTGKLWVIATPIGNLNEISQRAIDTLQTLDLLACESITAARRLYSALQITLPKLVLYREDSHHSTHTKIVNEIQNGAVCGLTSDAGSPGISDPGWRLVSDCHALKLPVYSLSGPSALTAALSSAGQPARRFLFAGFPPHKHRERQLFLQEVAQQTITTVFFETPHKILETLQSLYQYCDPQRTLSICRELTKLHENNQKRSLLDWITDPPPPRGEFVLILEGQIPITTATPETAGEEQAKFLLHSGLSALKTREFLETFNKLSRNQAYNLTIKCQQKISSETNLQRSEL